MQQSSLSISESTPPLLELTNRLAINLETISDPPLSERPDEPAPALEVSIDLEPEIIITSDQKKVEAISQETRKSPSTILGSVKD